MRHARKRAKLTTAVGILTMLFGALLVFAPSVNAASSRSGNLTCSDLLTGYTSVQEVKDDTGRNAPYPADTTTYASLTGGAFDIEYRLDTDGVRFQNSTEPIYAVFIKQAAGKQDLSVYETFSGVYSGFVAFDEGGFSHVSFCTGTPPQGTTGSISVDKHLGGNDAASHASDTFGFTLSCTLNGDAVALATADATFTLTAAQDPKVVSGIPTDALCTVTETGVNGGNTVGNPVSITVDGDTATTTASRSNISIGNGTTRDVDVTNTFTSVFIPPGCVDDPNTPQDECNPTPPEEIPDPASLTIVKAVAGDDAPDEWSFDFDGGNLSTFDLDQDRDSIPFTDLPEGSYTITELSAGDADLTSIVCSDGSAGAIDGDGDGGSVTVALAEGENVTCTFTNTFPDVLPAEEEPEPEPEPATPPKDEAVLGEQVVRLPRTGNESGNLAVVGFALLLIGATLVGGSRLRLRYIDQ